MVCRTGSVVGSNFIGNASDQQDGKRKWLLESKQTITKQTGIVMFGRTNPQMFKIKSSLKVAYSVHVFAQNTFIHRIRQEFN